MSRHPQWEQRLHAFIAESLTRGHDYEQQWDCLFGLAAGTAKAITGKDHARKHRGKYNSHASAYRYLKQLGHESVESFLDSLFEEKPVGFAQRGDLVLCDLTGIEDPELSASGPVPGVCMGAFALVLLAEHPNAQGHQGLTRVPRALWVKAWRVG